MTPDSVRTLMYFEPASHSPAPRATLPASHSQTAPVVIVETVTVQVAPSESLGYLTRPDSQWVWSDLRDYVVHEIEVRFGTFPRDAKKEYGIFTRFSKEFGADASRIARTAFEVHNGWWANAPISVNRFCKASDVYFGQPIQRNLLPTSS